MNLLELKEKYGYTIKHVIMPSVAIFNLTAPGMDDIDALGDFSERGIQIRKRAENIIVKRNATFYNKLEEDILIYGVENPILVFAGWVNNELMLRLPPNIKQEPRSILVGITGGSRLYIAQKHGLTVPCVIVDWIDRFVDLKPIETEEELWKLYKSPPTRYRFDERGLMYGSLPYHHLER